MPRRDSRKSLFIIVVGATIMLLGHFLFNGLPGKAPASPAGVPAEGADIVSEEHSAFSPLNDSEMDEDMVLAHAYALERMEPAGYLSEQLFSSIAHIQPEAGSDRDSLRKSKSRVINVMPRQLEVQQQMAHAPLIAPAPLQNLTIPVSLPVAQTWKDNAVKVENPVLKRGKVVIIIDDMGMSHKHSMDMINMDAPLTLAFLPYAPNLETMTQKARARGHELMIHMPMEPMKPGMDLGSISLLSSMDEAQMLEQLNKAFNSFEGYVGINNHMGSRLTQNEDAMRVVMKALAQRGLLFVDSKTINSSIAARVAAGYGLDHAERDVFLDHHETDEFVASALAQLEVIARRKGYAIAIGHPKAVTVNGLKKWLPTLEAKGLTLVPVSAVVRRSPDAILLTQETSDGALSAGDAAARPTFGPYQ
jgi:polysaccharide deacetylase 2 family uncharacterized protein YibQ